MQSLMLPVCKRELLQLCFFVCADFLLGQTGFGGWKSSGRIPLGKQTEHKHVVVDISEGIDVQVRVLL